MSNEQNKHFLKLFLEKDIFNDKNFIPHAISLNPDFIATGI